MISFLKEKISPFHVIIAAMCVAVSFVVVNVLNSSGPSFENPYEKEAYSKEGIDALKEQYKATDKDEQAEFKKTARGIYESLGDSDKENLKKYVGEHDLGFLNTMKWFPIDRLIIKT